MFVVVGRQIRSLRGERLRPREGVRNLQVEQLSHQSVRLLIREVVFVRREVRCRVLGGGGGRVLQLCSLLGF